MTTERKRAAKAAADFAAETDAGYDADYDDEAEYDDDYDSDLDDDEAEYGGDIDDEAEFESEIYDEADADEMATTVDLARADVRESGEGGRGRSGTPARPIARPLPAEASAEGDDDTLDPGATAQEQVVRTDSGSRPRKTTLSAAFSRPVSGERHTPPPDAVPDGVADEVDEWAAADQPTVYLPPRPQPAQHTPPGLRTRRPPAPANAPRPDMPAGPRHVPASAPMPPRGGGDAMSPPRRGTGGAGQRLAGPDGRLAPGTPPAGIPRGALPNPRMERFQELRRQRVAHADGERDAVDSRPVADMVRQWWSDLRPGLNSALKHQREARASGIHPIPAYEPVPTSRLGDAFGRLAASARELTGRAQAVAAPHLRRLHDQAEHATKKLVDRIEGSTINQQAPFLGPGRIAVFFKQGVTIGQAQRLLAASHARPIRLIPRKHGFLSLVPPGSEAAIAGRLRDHPYVRDVAFIEYDEYGQPVQPGEDE